MALVVETHAVDDATHLGQAEEARLRIALLRARGHRAHLDHAEAEPRQGAGHFGILVEPGGHADGIGEIEAAEPRRQLRRIGVALARHRAEAQGGQRRGMGGLGIHAQQCVARQTLNARQPQQRREGPEHQRTASGSSQWPSSSTAIGRSQATSARSSGPP